MVLCYEDPDLMEYFLDRMLDWTLRLHSNLLDEIGDYIQIQCVSDDLGFQDMPQLSPAVFRQYIKPRHIKIYKNIREKTDAKIMQHCCGSVYEIIPDLIEEGIQILNPIQARAANMNAEALHKYKGPGKLAFWGGIDEQSVLPHGSIKDVDNEVKRVIGLLAPGGGFVPFATHDLQVDIPPENVLAMFTAIRKYGEYPISV